MKLFLLVLSAMIVISCSENSTSPDGNGGDNEPSSPYDGQFYIAADLETWNCPSQPPIEEVPSRVSITVESDSITITSGNLVCRGTWTDSTRHAEAYGKSTCIPLTGCFQVYFNITFPDTNNFEGTYTVFREVWGQSGDTIFCQENFSITGTR